MQLQLVKLGGFSGSQVQFRVHQELCDLLGFSDEDRRRGRLLYSESAGYVVSLADYDAALEQFDGNVEAAAEFIYNYNFD